MLYATELHKVDFDIFFTAGFNAASKGRKREHTINLERESKAWFEGYDYAVSQTKSFQFPDNMYQVRKIGFTRWERLVGGVWKCFVPNQELSCSNIGELLKTFKDHLAD